MNSPGSSKLVALLRSEKWVITTFIFITIPLIIHTQHLMLKVTGFSFDLFPYDEQLYALFFALGFDLAMITFAVHGRTSQATGLAFIVFLFNCFFLNYDYLYNITGVTDTAAQIGIKVFINIAIAGTASWIVHSYVVFFNDMINGKAEKYELFGKIEKLSTELSKSNQEVERLKSEVAEVNKLREEVASAGALLILKQEEINALQIKLTAVPKAVAEIIPATPELLLADAVAPIRKTSDHVCEWCGLPFRTAGGLGSHRNTCKSKPAEKESLFEPQQQLALA